MATPYFLRKTALGRILCLQLHLRKHVEIGRTLRSHTRACQRSRVGDAAWIVPSFLSAAWSRLIYFLQNILFFASSHKVKDKRVDSKPPEEWAQLILRPPLTHHCVLRTVRLYLSFAALAAVMATTAWATQTQSNVGTLLEQARSEEKTGDYAAAERTYRQALTLSPDSLETLKSLGILEQTELKFEDY